MAVLPFVSAQAAFDIPTFEQSFNQTLNIPCNYNGVVCPLATECNTTILNPDGDLVVNNQAMFPDNGVFGYNLTEDNLADVGQYENTVSCCVGTNCRARELPFQVTPSGAAPLTTSQGTILFVVLGVLLFISIIFYIIGFRSEHIIGKVTGFSGGVVFTIMLILYTMFIITEAVSGTPNFVTGYETFLFVMKSVGTVLLLGLLVVTFMVMAKAWKVRRGILDK